MEKKGARFFAAVLGMALLVSACSSPQTEVPAPQSPSEASALEPVEPTQKQQESAPEEPASTASSEPDQTLEEQPDVPEGEDYLWTYLYLPGSLQYTLVGGQEAAEAALPLLEAAQAVGAVSRPEGLALEGELMLVNESFEKCRFQLYGGKGVAIDDAFYGLEPAAYATLKQQLTSDAAFGYAQWLIFMNPRRITKISAQASGEAAGVVQQTGEELSSMAYRLKHMLEVSATGSKTVKGKRDFSEDCVRISLTFDSGVVYDIGMNDNNLFVASSDMDFYCKYTLASPQDVQNGLYEWLAEAGIDAPPASYSDGSLDANPMTGKPVIYLYPKKEQEISVKLAFEGTLTYTFPDYGNGWRVKAQPDGTLTNLADGSTHYYLFWEGVPRKTSWDFSKGFVVKGSDSRTFLQEKLSALGLTPKEYNDFIVYWGPQLAENPYNLVTFSTTEYEEVAQLAISPKPDSMLVVHMVFRPLDAPVKIEEQTLQPFKRTGFAAVEWGGTRLPR